MKRTTLKAVNKALKAAGIDAELIRAPQGYHYFVGGDVVYCHSTSVYTCHTSQYTPAQWVKLAHEFKTEHVHKLVRQERFANGSVVLFDEIRPSYVTLDGEYTAAELEALAFAVRNARRV